MEILFIWLLMGVLSGVIAGKKNRPGLNWFFAGVLLGPIAIIIILFLPALPGKSLRQCPHCAELVKPEASKCRYCGSAIEPIAAAPGSCCPQCGAKVTPQMKWCPACQARFDAPAISKTS